MKTKPEFSFWDFFISINIYLATGIAFTGYGFSILLGGAPNFSVFLIIFLMTFSLYSLNRITDKDEDSINNPKRVAAITLFEKPLLALIALAYFLALVFGAQANLPTFLTVIAILLIGILYSVKIPVLKGLLGFPRFKDMLFGKNLFIGLNWVLAMVMVPAAYHLVEINLGFAVLAVFIFIRSIINSGVFDLADIEGDKNAGIRTLPILLGPKKTMWLFYGANTFLGAMVFCAAYFGILPPLAHLLNLSTVLVYVYLFLLSKPNIIPQRKLMDWVVDGEFILIGASILLIPYFW